MASVDSVRLVRRVDRHDEDIRALSDTVVDQHPVTLAEHGGMLVEILRRLEPVGPER